MSDLRRRRLRKARQAKQRRIHLVLIVAGGVAAVVVGAVLVSALAVNSVGREPARRRAEGDPARPEHAHLRQERRASSGSSPASPTGPSSRAGAIPKVLKDATVAIEDKRFYDHEGVNYYRLVGAAVRDLESGSATQGGSTITMQLAKTLSRPRADRTVGKKLEEVYLAFQYEKRYTKNQILARYLNGVFYGQNAVGVQAASLTYFDKDVRDITLPQAALLAGLPQAPTAYNPFENPDEARGRRNVVLEEMAEQGLHHARATPSGPSGPGSTSSAGRPTSASARSTSSSTSARC